MGSRDGIQVFVFARQIFTDYPFDVRVSSWPGTHQVDETG